jgi:hypothetical protein
MKKIIISIVLLFSVATVAAQEHNKLEFSPKYDNQGNAIIEVSEHADGTIARYEVLERGSIGLKPGDTVFPGNRIGLAGTLDGKTYQMRFSLYYMSDNLGAIKSLDNYTITYNYIDPKFATPEGETTLSAGEKYTPVSSEELVTKEMTKREIRIRQ